MSAANSDRISKYRDGVNRLLVALDDLRNQKKEMDALGGAAALLPQGEFDGANAQLVAAEFVNAVVSVETIDNFISGGFHNTNLYRVR